MNIALCQYTLLLFVSTEFRHRVAFSALLHADQVPKANSKLVLGEVLANAGGAYNGQTGVFTCKVPGLYQFTWTIHKMKGTAHTHMFLMKNNATAFVNYANYANDNFSGSLVTYLKQGDTVWIKMRQPGGYLVGGRHSAWSGLLL